MEQAGDTTGCGNTMKSATPVKEKERFLDENM
jgi:hypothetical protein